ncbi:MAG: tetratricopeptide repeat protein, partial [Desulfobulbaceae bacterium]|nr:tetratricopeptide repeat protein [Desulfobulbaceae bacterium]
LSSFFQEKKIQVFSVNIQGDEAPVIEQVATQSQSNVDVYVDQDRKAYAALGIFIMPTILLVDKDGKVADGMGYSHDIVDRLKGAVEVMLGEKTPEQVMAELRPEMKEVSEQEKNSRRHMDFGIVMRKRGQLETSIRELTKAIAIDPNLTQAHFELGCIYLEKGQLDNAEKAFDKALEKDPSSLRVRICKAKLKREKGQAEEAVKDLQVILQEHPETHDALYTLGRAYEDLNKMQEAMNSYKKAYTSIQQSVASEE